MASVLPDDPVLAGELDCIWGLRDEGARRQRRQRSTDAAERAGLRVGRSAAEYQFPLRVIRPR
ncbi:hypothetical protein, partial [uncultured Microbacterium sp.]|uniref:hypothetical protein n=1 Tax=uncultured Microbacterium sp. TaxID=191216 RepID=UPI0025F192D3